MSQDPNRPAGSADDGVAMSGIRYCPACGEPVSRPAARFCGRCGANLDAPTVEPPTAAASWEESEAARSTSPPQFATAYRPALSTVRDAAARHGLSADALFGGDWRGAARTAVGGVGAMVVFTALCLFLVGAATGTGDASVRDVVALVAMVSALAAGGSVNLDGQGFGLAVEGAASVVPLGATVVGFGVLGALFVRGLRSGGPSRAAVVLQAVRVWAFFVPTMLVVCLAGRRGPGVPAPGATTFETTSVAATTSIGSTLATASLLLAAALAVAVGWRVPTVLPTRWLPWRSAMAGPLVGLAVALTAFTALAVVTALLSPLFLNAPVTAAPSSGSGFAAVSAALGVALLVGPGLVLAAFGFALGVPAVLDLPFDLGPGQGSFDLLGLTDSDARFWLIPVGMLLAMVTGAAVAALHASTPDQARRRSWWFGIATALAVLLAAILTTVSVDGAGLMVGFHLAYVLGPVVGFAWGVATGWLGAVLAPRLPPPVKAFVRARVAGATDPIATAPTGVDGVGPRDAGTVMATPVDPTEPESHRPIRVAAWQMLVIGAALAVGVGVAGWVVTAQTTGAPAPAPVAAGESGTPRPEGVAPSTARPDPTNTAPTLASASASCTAPPGQDAAGVTTAYGPSMAVDGLTDTAWRCDGDGVGETFEIRLEEQATISLIGIVPGYAKTDRVDGSDRYAQNRRLSSVRIEFDDGTTITQVLDPDPTARGSQDISVPAVATTRVLITILGSAPGVTVGDLAPLDKIAISEVELS